MSMPMMSLEIVMNGPVAMAGSSFIFSRAIGTQVPKIDAKITTENRERETHIVNASPPRRKK